MSAVLERVAGGPLLSDEDRARAEHYAVLSNLFAGAPDADFLHKLPAIAANWAGADSPLRRAWQASFGPCQIKTFFLPDDGSEPVSERNLLEFPPEP